MEINNDKCAPLLRRYINFAVEWIKMEQQTPVHQLILHINLPFMSFCRNYLKIRKMGVVSKAIAI